MTTNINPLVLIAAKQNGGRKRISVSPGERFGKWVVWDGAIPIKGHMLAICRCSCGCFKRIQSTRLVSGLTKECHVCAISIHGQTKTRTWITWSSMHGRCANKNSPLYPSYGGRGITVCPEWGTFAQFLSDMGERPPKMSLDRIDVNGGYTRENCRWATARTQATNRRNTVWIEYEGAQHIAIDLAKQLGINYPTLLKRFRKGAKLDAPSQRHSQR